MKYSHLKIVENHFLLEKRIYGDKPDEVLFAGSFEDCLSYIQQNKVDGEKWFLRNVIQINDCIPSDGVVLYIGEFGGVV